MRRDGFGIGLLSSTILHAAFFGVFYYKSLEAKPQEIKPVPITLSLFEEEKRVSSPPKQEPKKEPKKIVQKQKSKEIKPLPVVKKDDVIPVKTVQAEPPIQAVQETQKPKQQISKAKADTDEVKKYLAKVRKILQDNLEYPYYAKKAGIEGVAVVCFCLKKDGSMPAYSLKISKSSGHALLDRHALETVQNSAPFPIPPSGEMEVTIPIAFSIKS